MAVESKATAAKEPTFNLAQLREASDAAFQVDVSVFDGAAKLAGFTRTDEIPKSVMANAIQEFLTRPVK